MTLAQLIANLRASMAEKLAERNTKATELAQLRSAETVDEARVSELRAAKDALDAELDLQQARVAELEAELARDDAADRLRSQIAPAAPAPGATSRETRVEVNEKRVYNRDSDPKGRGFLNDLARQFLRNDPEANDRLARHMREEIVERDGQIDRAAGTGAFSGLVIPQYLTDLYAPLARAGRPFADVCRPHDLPETGMTAYIGKVTTGTTTDIQAAEFDTVNETDIDDTLIPVSVQTNAGSQTLSRQAVERGIGVEDDTMSDLFSAYATTLDSKLLNQATTGLTNVATTITYTDATPTAVELYPKLLQAPAAVEAVMLNQMKVDDLVAVMHSRRWYWLQSQLTSTFPLFGSQGIAPQNVGLDYGKVYGAGFRGILPSGVPVVVDNNVATNKGAGTNEDEICVGARSEFHLWEDPKAPMLIRAEQSQSKKLAIDFVAYGYFAYLFTRRTHAQKISGTGLVTPAFA